jgi:cytoplasmic iron level regulating protein YaaA (DUF328/UPF0246 family)
LASSKTNAAYDPQWNTPDIAEDNPPSSPPYNNDPTSPQWNEPSILDPIVELKAHLNSLRTVSLAQSESLGKHFRDRNSLYNQQLRFQTLHEQHEQSTDAILMFLGTLFPNVGIP